MRGQRGQGLVELAIIMPLVLILFAGVFDLGRGMRAYMIVQNASREAALLGSGFAPSPGAVQAKALEELERGGLDRARAQVQVTYADKGLPAQEHILVQMDYNVPLLLSVLGLDALPLRATTEMVVFED